MVYPSLQGPLSVCEAIKEREWHALGRDLRTSARRWWWGPWRWRSVRLLTVSPWTSVRRNGGEGEVGGEHRERKGWGREGEKMWNDEGFIWRATWERKWKGFDQLQGLCHSSPSLPSSLLIVRSPDIVSHLVLALPSCSSSSFIAKCQPLLPSARILNCITLYLRPFKARPPPLLRTLPLSSTPRPDTTENLPKQYGATDPGKLVRVQRLLFNRLVHFSLLLRSHNPLLSLQRTWLLVHLSPADPS